MLAIAAGSGAARVGILPAASPTYDAVWAVLMPLAAALLLLQSPLRARAVDRAAAPPAGVDTARHLTAFAIAVLGTLVGTVAAWLLVGARLPADGGAAVAAALTGSYIGGTLNFAAIVQVRAADTKLCTCAWSK